VEQLDDDWRIYSAANPRNNNHIFDYELVRFKKHEEYKMGGSVIPKGWSYPTANAFGRDGFSCPTLAAARRKYRELQEERALTSEKTYSFSIPVNVPFSITKLAKELGVPYSRIYARVKELGKKVSIVKEIKNTRGKNTRIYINNL
jgi:hypothetical protein